MIALGCLCRLLLLPRFCLLSVLSTALWEPLGSLPLVTGDNNILPSPTSMQFSRLTTLGLNLRGQPL